MTDSELRRRFNSIEALGCFALMYLASGWVAVFWGVFAFLSLFGAWDWPTRLYLRRRWRRVGALGHGR